MQYRFFRFCLAIAAMWICQTPTSAQTNSYWVGTGVVEITPSQSIRLTGYGSRAFESEGVEQKIFARAVAIRESKTSPAIVICAAELLGITPELRQAVLQQVKKAQPLANERFVLCATHTHTGPCVNSVCPLILGDTIRPDPTNNSESMNTRGSSSERFRGPSCNR